ncbi:hypothetical protein CFC21_046028 [Triticum aestivum]|uniref:F-box domain-containing protein n=4 Tax=Triticinae TaxID=1648030 RepID=A0A453E2N8_AEGTS|nr:hypothetical protein CFC21_046028 [Triticum aestivum]
MLGAGLGSRISKAMAALLRRRRRLLRIATPAGSGAPWSELPPDLLFLVLSRLPSYADRVSLRAVCRPWRSAARLQPFAWLFVRADTFLALPEGALHRMPLDRNQILLRVPIATGRMFFLVHRDGSCYLTNPSSGESTPLHISSDSLKIDLGCRSYNWIRKVVVSDGIVAVPYCGMVTIFPRMASPGQGARLCWVPPAMFPTASIHVDTDIALFQGELYVVLTNKHNKSGSELPELHRLEIDDEQNRVRSVQCIRRTPRNHVDDPARSWTPRNGMDRTWRSVFYLVPCGDRLLMVERRTLVERFVVWEGAVRQRGSRPIRTQLEAWEGVDLIGGHGHWSKVDTLMGHALFVSRGCSQSLPASAQCGAQQDCIYFAMTERPRRKREPQDDVFRCVVYNVRDGTMEPLETSEPTVRPWEPTWFFPAHA